MSSNRPIRSIRQSVVVLMTAVVSIACMLISPTAHSQISIAVQGTRRDDVEKARLLGILTFTKITISFDETPIRDALKTLGGLLHITFTGRFNSATDLRGIDPESPVSLEADQRFAVDILEEMLEQCAVDEPLTWQLRLGTVEVGTKRRLSSLAARETRTYEMTDLLIEPPTFVPPYSGHGSRPQPSNSPYIEALLGAANRQAAREGVAVARKSKSELMLELMEGMVETIEPGHWDFGADSAKDETPDDHAEPQQSDASHNGPGSRPAPSRKPVIRPRPADPDHWASIRAWREGLLITAPDFMHRQLGGYPKPIPPLVTSIVAPPLDEKPTASPPKH